MNTEQARVLVVGAGVIGLTTALALAEHGHAVVVTAAPRDEFYASTVAGALWLAYEGHEPRAKVHAWSTLAQARFAAIARGDDPVQAALADRSRGALSAVPGVDDAATLARVLRGGVEAHGVRLGRVIEAHEARIDPLERGAPYFAGTPALPWALLQGPREIATVAPHLATAGYASAYVVDNAPLVDPGRFLPWLHAACAAVSVRGPGSVTLRLDAARVSDVAAAARRERCAYAVVAAGLGSSALMRPVVGAALAGEPVGIRGQVRIVKRNFACPGDAGVLGAAVDTSVCLVPAGAGYGTEGAEAVKAASALVAAAATTTSASESGSGGRATAPLSTATAEAYVIPRVDSIVLGGTFDRGQTENLTPDPATAARIVRECLIAVPGLAGAETIRDVCGVRPAVRDGRVRCGVLTPEDPRASTRDGVTVLANYGHAGLGYTMCFGCAEQVAHEIDGLAEAARKASVQARL
jgi:glycine/D-amino acid oxidase-like deaminating enzyme